MFNGKIDFIGSKENSLSFLFRSSGTTKLGVVTQQWKERQLTNWEYLMALNQISGRTFLDLMQYPVFPWILADYKSSTLDLTNSNAFRNLEKPIAVQHPENEAHYISNYNVTEIQTISF